MMRNDQAYARVPDSETFVLEIGDPAIKYRIDVALPPVAPAIGLNAATASLPVIYVLDGDAVIGQAAGVSRFAQLGGDAASHIVVGIGYPGADDDLEQWTINRCRDLSPHPFAIPVPAFADMPTGGGDAFWHVLRDQVFPAVETRYDIDPARRHLIGASLGGLFVSHILDVDRGQTFHGYGIVSPAYFHADGAVLQRMQQLQARDMEVGTLIHMAVGSLEEAGAWAPFKMVTNTQLAMDALAGAGLAVTGGIIDGETHNTVYASAYGRALRAFVPKNL